MNVIVDVNVWISALLWGGIPSKILYLARHQKIIIFISDAIILELETTLKRPKFSAQIQKRGHSIDYFISVVTELSFHCPTIFLEIPSLRDPKDTIILAAAITAEAKAIITGDLDLLVLVEFNDIPILNPQNFLEQYFPNFLKP